MTKTYSEAAQAVLFKASRDMRKVAASVLDDCTNSVELRPIIDATLTNVETDRRKLATERQRDGKPDVT